MATLFLSDLHLSQDHPDLTELFFAFLRGPAREAEAVYLLGDLFEYWAGDDDAADALNAGVAGELRALTDAGVRTYFMAGNRDFLVGAPFAARAGLTLIADPTRIDLYGRPTLLMHGDTLCTDDLAYMRFRRIVRSKAVRALFLALPLSMRKAQIEAIRRRSEAAKQTKATQIMDVSEAAVATTFRAHPVTQIIHGHTHRPATHTLDVDGRSRTRIVLADWRDGHGEYLRADATGLTRVTLGG